MKSPTRPLPAPACIGPGARTAIGSSVGRLSMPVNTCPLSDLGRGWATLTVNTFAMPGAYLPATTRADDDAEQSPDSAAFMRHRCHMKSQKVPSPNDIKAAAQAAAETAQSVASGAMRIPPASLQLARQLPDLLENLATATERLNTAIDRAERYLALADPMIRTMDALLPQLEALVATGNDVYKAVSTIPGVSTLGRLATRTTEAPTRKRASKGHSAQRDS